MKGRSEQDDTFRKFQNYFCIFEIQVFGIIKWVLDTFFCFLWFDYWEKWTEGSNTLINEKKKQILIPHVMKKVHSYTFEKNLGEIFEIKPLVSNSNIECKSCCLKCLIGINSLSKFLLNSDENVRILSLP